MKICKIIFAILFFMSYNINKGDCQWQWANRAGDSDDDVGRAVCNDPSGNVYLVGDFRDAIPLGGVDFGGILLTGISPVISSGFVAKYNSSGSIIWAKSFTAPGQVVCQAISYSGNYLYITGSFAGLCDFGNGITLSSANQFWSDIFILKIDASTGNSIAAQIKQSSYVAVNDVGFGIEVKGNFAYVTGQFEEEYFVSKYDVATLNEQWTAYTSGGGENCLGVSVVVDASDNVYTYGTYFAPTNFHSSNGAIAFNLPAVIGQCFIAKYDPNGINTAIQRVGFNSNFTIVPGQMEIDDSDNIVIVGSYECSGSCTGSIYLENGNQLPLSFSGLHDGFIGKYNSSLVGQWAIKIGSAGVEDVNSVSLDNVGNIYFLGSCQQSTAVIGCITLIANPTLSNFYFGKFDPAGNPVWAHQKIGNGDIYQHDDDGIVNTNADEVVFTNYTTTSEIYGSFPLTNVGGDDVTLSKFRGASADAGPDVTLCSGEEFTLTSYGAGIANWTGPEVSCINCSTYTFTPTISGTYTLNVVNPYGCSPLTDQITITVNPAATVDLGSDRPACDGPINLDAGGGMSDYDWVVPGNCLYGGQFANTCVTGNYCVTVTNSYGCTAEDCVFITLGQTPTGAITYSPNPACIDEDLTLGILTSCNNCDYMWWNGDEDPSTIDSSPSSGTYTVTITDAAGCSAEISQYIDVINCGDNSSCLIVEKPNYADVGRNIKATPDGGFIFVGQLQSMNGTSQDMYVMKYDALLNPEFFQRIFESGGTFDESGHALAIAPDGYYLAGSATNSSGNKDVYVAKIDLIGALQWATRYGSKYEDVATNIQLVESGEKEWLLVTGYTNSFGVTILPDYDMFAMKLNTDGTYYGTPYLMTYGKQGSNEYCHDATSIKDDNSEFVLAGHRYSAYTNTYDDAMVVKISDNLSMLDNVIIDGEYNEEAFAVVRDNDNFLIAGRTTTYGQGGGDIYIVNFVSSTLAMASNMVYGTTKNEMALDLIKVDKDKFALTGIYDEGGLDTKAIAIKFDDTYDILNEVISSRENSTGYISLTYLENYPGYGFVGTFRDGTGYDEIFISRSDDNLMSCCVVQFEFDKKTGFKSTSGCDEKERMFKTSKHEGSVHYFFTDWVCGYYGPERIINPEDLIQNENALSGTVQIFPNPANGNFTVRNAKNEIESLKVFDLAGREIKTNWQKIDKNSGSIQMENFTNGIYFVKVYSGTETFVSKISIQQ